MEDDGFDPDARVTGQRIAEVAELPPRLAVDQEDPGLFGRDADGDGLASLSGRLSGIGVDACPAGPTLTVIGVVPGRSRGTWKRTRALRRGRLAAAVGDADRLPQWEGRIVDRSGPARERDRDVPACPAVDLDEGLDRRDVPLEDRLGRPDLGHGQVARGGRRADHQGVDRNPGRLELPQQGAPHRPRRPAILPVIGTG